MSDVFAILIAVVVLVLITLGLIAVWWGEQ